MKQTIIVDTDVIVQYLKTGKGVLPTAYEKFSMIISSATFTELLASKTFQDSALEKEVLEFVDKYFTIKEINRRIAAEAAKIIRKHEVNLATAYVAATAVVEGIKILSEDQKTFAKIEGIEMIQV